MKYSYLITYAHLIRKWAKQHLNSENKLKELLEILLINA